MTINIAKVAFGVHLSKAFNTVGIGATLDYIRSPYWELNLAIQPLIPWELSFTIGKRI